MYTIKAFTADGEEFWIHNRKTKDLTVGDPWYEVGDNINGSAEFTVYPDHPFYSRVKKLTTEIIIYRDDEEKFRGRVLYDDEDLRGAKHVVVEGELGYLNDSIQRPAVYHDIPPKTLCQTYLEIHNEQVENRKKFELGLVTVEDSNDSLYRYSNYETTRDTFQGKLVDRLGGHLVVRHEADNRILDYLSDDTYYVNASQTIKFGKNLLDYAKNIDATDVVTCLIPLGAAQDEEDIEGLVKYLDITSVNGGVDYVTDDAAVEEYGRIFGTEMWDDVTLPENLMTKAREYLKTVQYENLVLELTAVDMNLADAEVQELEVGMKVRCISEPHDMDEWYPISRMRVYLMDAGRNTFTLGTEKKNQTYTSSNLTTQETLTKKIDEIPTKGEILKEAMADATDLINQAVASGYAIHEPNEFIVADDIDYKGQAKNLWRWGMGGLAHYSNGYYGVADGVALTMDGHINGEFITAGSVMAESINFGYTEIWETAISDAEESANEYTDVVKETITNSITNLENRIALTVVSTKEAIVQKNYLTNGETETITLDAFDISGTAATVELVEHENVNCIKLTFTSGGAMNIQQALGTLPAGNYTVQCETEYDSGYRTPNYIRIGFTSSYNTVNYSTLDADIFNCVKQQYEISESSRTFYAYVYGYSGSVVYLKNLRCLRNFQELLDEVSSELTVAINEVSAKVSETLENSSHDYCTNGDFADGLTGWTASSSSAISATLYDGKYCAEIVNSGTSYSIYQRFTNPKEGPVRIKFKAACASGGEDTARARVLCGGTNQYTARGDLTTEWQEFTFDYESVSAGTVVVYFYNYISGTTIYFTDIEILGYYSYYAESQLTVLSDSITAEVSRATSEEESLRSSIQLTTDSITAEVTRATSAESELKSSIQINADNITSCVTKDNVGSYITQYYDNVIVAFNNNSKYVQISAGAISIYDASITDSALRNKINESGSHFYRDGYYVGEICTNSWASNTSHKGLDLDLETQGKFITMAERESDSVNTYSTVWTYSRANSIYTDAGLHAGCNAYFHNYHLDGASLYNTLAEGYETVDYAYTLFVNSVSSSGSGSISVTYGSMIFRNGMLTSIVT